MEPPTEQNFSSRGTLPYLPNAVQRQMPAQLGRYKLLEQIGAGGMGVVYKALHVGLKRIVALKVLHANMVGAADFAARFHREIEALGRLDHPNVVRATDGGEEAGMLFLVMDFVDGKDLDRLIKTLGPLATANACELIRQAAVGLDYIRRRGLIHRDIKPSNLFLSNEGIVKILDLGLARLREHEGNGDELTPTGIAMGTADYLAPEQAQDSSRVDIRADIYSLGCSLFKLLCGRPPFSGPRFASMAQKIWAHAHTPLPPCENTQPLPAGLLTVLHKMTAKDPSQRQATPGEVAEALRPFAAGSDLLGLLAKAQEEPTTAPLPVLGGTRLAESTPPEGLSETKEGPSTLQQPQVSRKRGGWMPWTVALIFLVGAALGIYWTVSSWGKGRNGETGRSLELAANPNPLIQPSLEKPDTPAPLRSLDDLPPLRWHDLLEREPTVGLWFPGEGLSSWKLDRDLHQLTVSTDRDALLHLGTLKQPNYTFQIAITQPRWTGGVGIYLGYREIAPQGKLAGVDTPVAQFQLLNIQRRDKAGVESFLLTRGRGVVLREANGRTRMDAHLFTSQELPVLFGEQILEVTVMGSKMQRVRLGGVDLPKLVQADVNEEFTAQDYAGCLGTLTATSSAVFRNARLMIHAGF